MKDKQVSGPKPYKSGHLNLKFLGRMLWIMLLGNIILALLLFGWTLTSAERSARALLSLRSDWTESSGEQFEYVYDGMLSLNEEAERMPGLTLPGFMQHWAPMDQEGVVRRVAFAPVSWGVSAWLRSGVYHMWLPEERLEITYDIGPALVDLWRVLCVLSVFQLFLLLSSIGKGARAIRRTLRPLYQMIEQAHSLSRNTAPVVRVDGMAGELYDIDGRRLHRRISERDAPEELRPLAAAINDMLARIEAAYEAQARFVSDASHELRTPIAVIQGYVNLLDRWGKTDEATLQESIEALKSEAKGMGEMVEQLLFLARGDSDAIALTPETVELGALCEEVARDMRVARPDCEITVKAETAQARADRALCRQALRILLDNAVKYGEGRPVAMVVGADGPGWVAVSVSDSGPGIAPEDLPHIFDRFYRSDSARSRDRETGGAGLGLPIARWIAVRHGGQLTALSRPGIGTRMSLRLPEDLGA